MREIPKDLPPGAQKWVRQVNKDLELLLQDSQRQREINRSQNITLDSVMKALRGVRDESIRIDEKTQIISVDNYGGAAGYRVTEDFNIPAWASTLTYSLIGTANSTTSSGCSYTAFLRTPDGEIVGDDDDNPPVLALFVTGIAEKTTHLSGKINVSAIPEGSHLALTNIFYSTATATVTAILNWE